jgi:SAM-dependent methyltransferase
MLAPKKIPTKYRSWNNTWGAPFGFNRGHLAADFRGLNREGNIVELASLHGPFAMQACSSTRQFEYPWAYDQFSQLSARSVVEVGGGLSGFQIVLALAGAQVINVDPGGAGFTFDQSAVAAANNLFGTDVELRKMRLADAGIADQSIDVVTCLSTLEHLEVEEVRSILSEVFRILRPGGRLILTVDLFLDLAPFTSRTWNVFGRNIPLWQLLTSCGYQIEIGTEAEILSSPTFDPIGILERLATYLVGDTYPVLAQLLVLSKRS